MNLVLLFPRELDEEGRATVTGRRAAHIRDVLGSQPGHPLRVGVVGGGAGRGKVVAVGTGGVTLEIPRPLAHAASGPGPVDLLLALPRPKVLSRVVQIAACCAVGRLDLVNAWRVDKAYFSSPRAQLDRLTDDLTLGCEQGGVTWLPRLACHRRLIPALDDLPAPDQDGRLRVVAHPRAERDLGQVVRPGERRRVVVAVGPEGGWIDRELTSFGDRGFTPVSLGSSVLRVEAAVPALLTAVSLLRRLPPTTCGTPKAR